MESDAIVMKLWSFRPAKLYGYLLLTCLLFCIDAGANPHFYKVSKSIVNHGKDSIAEKKVDYLEKIYFSGKNKDQLNTMILLTIEDIEEKPETKAVAKQYVFLFGIKDKTNAAENACEVEEILAVGIYGIDPREALQQNIPKPSSGAANKAGDAMANVDQLGKSANNLAASSVYTLKGGSYSYYAVTQKVSGVTNTVSGATSTVNNGKQVVDQFNKTLASFGLHAKDKPCKNVTPKDIEIGPHLLSDTVQKDPKNVLYTRITFKSITYNQLSAVSSAIEKIQGVSSVNSDNFSNNTAILLVGNKMKVKELVDKVLQANAALKINVESISNDEAILSIK